MQSINVDNSDFIWPHLVIIRQKMYQWKIEDQQNLRMSTYRWPEILIRLVSGQQDVFHAGEQSTVRLSYDREVRQHSKTQPPFTPSSHVLFKTSTEMIA